MSVKAIMRYESTNFLDTTPLSEEGSTWALMNKGIESGTVSSNATESERHYIADKGATVEVTALGKTMDITQYAYKNDATFEYVDDLFFNDSIGTQLETNILQVFNYRGTGTGGIPAKLTKCIIVPADHGGDGGDQLSIAYNVRFSGDSVIGKVVITAGKPVFTADTVSP